MVDSRQVGHCGLRCLQGLNAARASFCIGGCERREGFTGGLSRCGPSLAQEGRLRVACAVLAGGLVVCMVQSWGPTPALTTTQRSWAGQQSAQRPCAHRSKPPFAMCPPPMQLHDGGGAQQAAVD